MEADDLMAAVFPTLAACQENVAPGPLEIPDHPLVRQTLEDCLHEAMDIDGLRDLLDGIEAGRITVITRDTTEPSVLAHEILNGQPFTYLDDETEAANRRSRQVRIPRGLPVQARDLARLDPGAIERVRDEIRPQPRDADELHDLLMTLFAMRPQEAWRGWFDDLSGAGRAAAIGDGLLWCAAERQTVLQPLYPGLQVGSPQAKPMDPETVAAEMLRGHLEIRGPSTAEDLARATALQDVTLALIRLENEGFALRGHFTDPAGPEEFCARRVLTRIHAYTRQRKRREVEPVTARDFMRFLLRWQHVTPDTRREGTRGVLSVVEQLQGFELAAGAWEKAIFPARVTGYRREWLDEACLDGGIAWGRLSVRGEPDEPPRRGGLTPSRATPVTLTIRDDLPWLLRAARGEQHPAEPGPGSTADVIEALRNRGALFPPDLATLTGRLPSEIEEALWDGVARGLVTADGFRAVRSLFARRAAQNAPGRHRLRRGSQLSARTAGRWSLLPEPPDDCDPDDLAEAVAEQLAARWGVVFRDLLARENLAVPWREVLWALRRMEARGTISGGRFVAGFSGEQFAHPDAVGMLREIRKRPLTGETIVLSAADPLNLAGIVLPGPRIPALGTNSVSYTDGAATADPAVPYSPPEDERTCGGRLPALGHQRRWHPGRPADRRRGPAAPAGARRDGLHSQLAAPVGGADQPLAGDGHGPARPGHQRRHRALRHQPGVRGRRGRGGQPGRGRPGRRVRPQLRRDLRPRGGERSTGAAPSPVRAARPAGRAAGMAGARHRHDRRRQPGRAMMSFLTEIIGLTEAQVSELRNAPRSYDVMPIASATMPREAQAIADTDLTALAAEVPVLLILGSQSPAWARDLTGSLAAALPQSTLAVLDGQGHDAIETAPGLLGEPAGLLFGYRLTVSARCGSFQPGRTKWHV